MTNTTSAVEERSLNILLLLVEIHVLFEKHNVKATDFMAMKERLHWLISREISALEATVREETAQQAYLECLVVECGERECARAIRTKFGLVEYKEEQYNTFDFPVMIKNKRKELGESGTEFGKRFGVTHAAVSDWENGKSQAGYDVLNFVLANQKETA